MTSPLHRSTGHNTLTSADELRSWLVQELAQRLGRDASTIQPHVSLIDYGLDSFHATTLSGDLSRKLGRKFSPVLLWDYPTIDSLARHLAGEHVEPVHADNFGAEFAGVD